MELWWVEDALYLIIPILVAIAIRAIYPALKSKYMSSTTEEQRRVIAGYARTVVLAVEGYMTTSRGQEKYLEAERRLNEILAQKGIEVTVSEIKTQLEAAVYDELNRHPDPAKKSESESLVGKTVSLASIPFAPCDGCPDKGCPDCPNVVK